MRELLLCVCMIALMLRPAFGATPFFDTAALYTSWSNGVPVSMYRGGEWSLVRTSGDAGGFFLGSSEYNAGGSAGIDTDEQSFGLWAPSGARVEAIRTLGGGLAPGQAISFDLDNGWIDSGGFVGVVLRGIGGTRVEFSFAGGATNYGVTDARGTFSTAIPFTGDGVHAEIALLTLNSYELRAWDAATPLAVFSATGTLSGPLDAPITEMAFFSAGAGDGSNYDAFWNNIRLSGTTHDEAGDSTYSQTWTNGADGGIGWDSGWTLDGWGGHGFFVDSSLRNGSASDSNEDGDIDDYAPNSTSGRAWGMYAHDGGVAEAYRLFPALSIGEAFEVQLDNGWLNNGAVAGMALQSTAGSNLVEVYFVGGGSEYVVSDDLGARSTGIPFTDEGLFIQIAPGVDRFYNLQLRRLDGNGATNIVGLFSGTASNSPARVVRFFYYNPGEGGTPRDLYINRIGIGPQTGPEVFCTDVLAVFPCAPSSVEFTTTVFTGTSPASEPLFTPPSTITFPIGTTVVSCVVTDQLGNVAAGSFNVIATVQDNTPPVFSNVPADTIVECGTNEAPFLSTDVGSVTAWDDCDGPPYLITRKFVVSDSAGNTAAATQLVSVVDTQPPQLLGVPTNMTVAFYPIPAPPLVTAEDVCEEDAQISFEDSFRGVYQPQIRRIWRAIDGCGNSVSATQLITVTSGDFDGDGLLDNNFTNVPISYVPLGVDADADGFADTESMHNTDPFNPDSDGDGWDDGLEVIVGRSPVNPFGETGLNTNGFYHNSSRVAGATWERVPGSWQRFLMLDYERGTSIVHILAPQRVAVSSNISVRLDVRYSWTTDFVNWTDSMVPATLWTTTVIHASEPFHGLPTRGSLTVNVYRAEWAMPSAVSTGVVESYYAPRLQWLSNDVVFATEWLVRDYPDGEDGYGVDDFLFGSQLRGPDFFENDYPLRLAEDRVQNGAFEMGYGIGAMHWTPYGWGGGVSDVIAHSGQRSYVCRDLDGLYQRVVVHPGEELTLSSWMLTPSHSNPYDTNQLSAGRSGEMAIVYLDREGRTLSTRSALFSETNAPDTWIYHSITSLVPPHASAANVLLRIVGVTLTNSPGHVYFDDVEISVSADADSDGMPDRWEQEWGEALNLLQPNDAIEDPDADALLNIDEFRAGSSPILSDTDDDGLLDGWEVNVGLSPLNPYDALSDIDGDGLTASDEQRIGTSIHSDDTDGDGIDDATEYYDLKSDPLTPDAPTLIVAASVSGTATTARVGAWIATTNGLIADGLRGSLSYTLSAPSSDVYRLSVRVGARSAFAPRARYMLRLSVDGVFIRRVPLLFSGTEERVASVFLPWLPAGEHSIRLDWDNSSDALRLRVAWLALEKLDGPDADFNGRKDWVDSRLARLSGIDAPEITSIVSPAVIEGRDSYGAFWTGNPAEPQRAVNGRWYASVSLAMSNETSAVFGFQNNGVVVTSRIQWAVTDVLMTTGTLHIRTGDSLKIACAPSDAPDGQYAIAIAGNTTALYSRAAGEYVYHVFNEPGSYWVSGTFLPNSGSPTSGLFAVTVYDSSDLGTPACWIGKWRNWHLPDVPTNAWVETSAGLAAELVKDEGGIVSVKLLTAVPEDYNFVVRLPRTGLVLGVGRARGFYIADGSETAIRTLGVCRDGTAFFETQVICSPLIADLHFEGNIIIGGVLYTDGAVQKTLTATDFDEVGVYRLGYIRAASSRSSFCNTFDVYQGTNFVGRYKDL